MLYPLSHEGWPGRGLLRLGGFPINNHVRRLRNKYSVTPTTCVGWAKRSVPNEQRRKLGTSLSLLCPTYADDCSCKAGAKHFDNALRNININRCVYFYSHYVGFSRRRNSDLTPSPLRERAGERVKSSWLILAERGVRRREPLRLSGCALSCHHHLSSSLWLVSGTFYIAPRKPRYHLATSFLSGSSPSLKQISSPQQLKK